MAATTVVYHWNYEGMLCLVYESQWLWCIRYYVNELDFAWNQTLNNNFLFYLPLPIFNFLISTDHISFLKPIFKNYFSWITGYEKDLCKGLLYLKHKVPSCVCMCRVSWEVNTLPVMITFSLLVLRCPRVGKSKINASASLFIAIKL